MSINSYLNNTLDTNLSLSPRYFNTFHQASVMVAEPEEDVIAGSFIDKFFRYIIIKRLERRVTAINKELAIDLETLEINVNDPTTMKLYKKILNFLNIFDPFFYYKIAPPHQVQGLHNELKKFVDQIKVLEMRLRCALYPDRNEVVFTYDELRELKGVFKDSLIEE